MAGAVGRYYANSARLPHDWGPWLEFADWCDNKSRTCSRIGQLCRDMYSVLHGCWGDATLVQRICEAAADHCSLTCLRTPPVYTQNWPQSKLAITLIPPGSFVMGSPETEPGHRHDEAQVAVTLTHGFWLGLQPVLRYQWETVLYGKSLYNSETRRPCVDVSWDDTRMFLDKLNKEYPIPGWRYDLPTEAQWEYACRAGTNTAYAFGDTITKSQANFDGAGVRAPGDCAPNAFGLHDMHGNVWEWCRDNYTSELPGGVDPYVGTSPGNCRVLRGGSWDHRAWFARSAYRGASATDTRSSSSGFRVALVVDV